VNTVMNLRVHKMLGSSWVAAQLAAYQEGLSSMKGADLWLHAGTKFKWMVSLRLWPLYLRDKSPQSELDKG
jgi:hypothetical protein